MITFIADGIVLLSLMRMIIQAGSVVVKNVPPLAIMGGHPAKQFSERSVSHYENLDSSHNT
ncbi:hypothetical protein ACPSKX_00215 [Moritella viscosa]